MYIYEYIDNTTEIMPYTSRTLYTKIIVIDYDSNNFTFQF